VEGLFKVRKTLKVQISLWAIFLVTCLGAFGQSQVKVTGLGFLGNLDMERRVVFLSGSEDEDEKTHTPRDIEDISYIILQQLRRDGYAHPEVTATMKFIDGEKVSYTWTPNFKSQYTDEMTGKAIKAVQFDCNAGTLNHYSSVEVQGVKAIDEDTVQEFFMPSGVLLTRKKDLAFTEANLQARLNRILASLNSLGFLKASVHSRHIEIDPSTGKVDVLLQFEEGDLHHVGEVRIKQEDIDGSVESRRVDHKPGIIFNANWLREQRQQLLNTNYQEGYPDIRINVERTVLPGKTEGISQVDVEFNVKRGQYAHLTGVRFEPEGLLKNKLLIKTVDLDLQKPFDLLQIEEGRRNLLSLGVLNDVNLQQEFVGQDGRIAVYSLTPLPRQNLHLLAGWGSYEQARIGLKWEQLNLWNQAHRYEFDAIKSFKSTNVDLTYIVPHFFQREITAYVRTGYEFREEISYDRSTTTFLMGASRRLEKLGVELSLEYSLEGQRTDRDSPTSYTTQDSATVSSLFIRGVMDRRDSALYPTTGYDASLSSKSAAEFLGGNSNFQKFELAASYHRYLFSALYLHSSLRYGGIFSQSPSSENLPFNERFFQGGENSIRGYTQGEASPITPDGQLTGAETFVLVNLELEQRLFSNIALILFWDGLAQRESQEFNSDIEYLQSIGVGLRLRTPIGPVRLEYGHNLNPRPSDPDGTLHFSVGFPF